MSKYDWSNVPKEVQWLATDQGDVFPFGFTQKPKIVDWGWVSNHKNINEHVVNGTRNQVSAYKGSWRGSLEQRPQVPA